jgi:predicted TIM-barrel fold metal-dependent hydrolase
MPAGATLGRRTFLGGASALAGSLGGCAGGGVDRPAPLPPLRSDIPVIDAHCHVFNAADLPVEGFVEEVHVDLDESMDRRALDGLFTRLTQLILKKAPDEHGERRLLAALPHAGRRAFFDRGWRARDEPEPVPLIHELLALIQAGLNRDPFCLRAAGMPSVCLSGDQALALADIEAAASGTRMDIAARISAEERRQYPRAARLLASRGLVGNFLRWVVQLTRYRYRMIEDLFAFHAAPESGERGLDIATPALIDYDYWVYPFAREVWPEEQVRLMAELAIRYQGRVHPFVAFNPLKQVLFEDRVGRNRQEPRFWVRKAIEELGFVGVKLYPPMGFRPIGNRDLRKEDFAVGFIDWLVGQKGAAYADRLGRRLDDVLLSFYRWCVAHDVPVMAHCRESQFPRRGFGLRAHPRHWRHVLETDGLAGLRLNLAHFGNTAEMTQVGFQSRDAPARCAAGRHEPDGAGCWSWMVAELIGDGRFPNVYADAGYFAGLLEDRDPGDARRPGGAIDDRFTKAGMFVATLAAMERSFPAVPARIMYGSDWNMLGAEAGNENYFRRFRRIMRHMPAAVQAAFFGGNAARFLGLYRNDARGRPNRAFERLRGFYRRHGMAEALAHQRHFFDRAAPE